MFVVSLFLIFVLLFAACMCALPSASGDVFRPSACFVGDAVEAHNNAVIENIPEAEYIWKDTGRSLRLSTGPTETFFAGKDGELRKWSDMTFDDKVRAVIGHVGVDVACLEDWTAYMRLEVTAATVMREQVKLHKHKLLDVF